MADVPHSLRGSVEARAIQELRAVRRFGLSKRVLRELDLLLELAPRDGNFEALDRVYMLLDRAVEDYARHNELLRRALRSWLGLDVYPEVASAGKRDLAAAEVLGIPQDTYRHTRNTSRYFDGLSYALIAPFLPERLPQRQTDTEPLLPEWRSALSYLRAIRDSTSRAGARQTTVATNATLAPESVAAATSLLAPLQHSRTVGLR